MAVPYAEQQVQKQQAARRQPQSQQYEPMPVEFLDRPQEQQQSALMDLAYAGLSGVAAVGNYLDTPGSMVRDTLVGQNPLDNVMVPWSSANRTDGRDMLRQWGVLDPQGEDTWGNFGAGFLAEVATDPLSWAVPGSWFLKAHKMAGGLAARTAKGTSNLARQLPVVGPSLGMASDAIVAAGNAAGRLGVAAFDKSVQGAMDTVGQGAARKASKIKAGAKKDAISMANRYRSAFKRAGVGNEDWEQIRSVMESPDFRDGKAYEMPERLKPVEIEMREMGNELDQLLVDYQEVGLPLHELVDPVTRYFPRQETRLPSTVKRSLKSMGVNIRNFRDHYMEPRQEFLKGVDEGTSLWNEITSDPEIVGIRNRDSTLKNADVANMLKEKYGERLMSQTLGHGPNRDALRADALATGRFGGEEEVDAVLALHDAFFSRLGEKTGKKLDDFYGEAYQTIQAGDDPAMLGRGALRQQGKDGIKGAVEFSPQDGRAILTAFQSADVSTFAHESGHVFRRMLAKHDSELHKSLQDAMGTVMKKGVVDSKGNWTRAAEEAFAKRYERYLRDGRAPNGTLRKAFRQFKDWMTKIYESLSGTRLAGRISPELRTVFDAMLTPKTVRTDKHISELAEWVGKMDYGFVEAGGYFNRNPLDDFQDRIVAGFSTIRNVNSLMDEVATIAKPIDEVEGGVSVAQTIRNAGLTDKAFVNMQGKMTKQRQDAMRAELTQQMEANPASGITPEFIEQQVNNIQIDDLDQFAIPAGFVNDFARITRPLVNPQEMSPFLKLAHMGTSIFKKGVTTPFPAFHVRNRFSGEVQNYLLGLYGDNPAEAFRAGKDARTILRGNEIKGASQWEKFKGSNLTDRQATDMIIQSIIENEVIGAGQSIFDDTARSEALENLTGQLSGVKPETRTRVQALKKYVTTLGENASDYVEFMNRVSPFLSQVRRNITPDDAAKRVKVSQIDYNNLTDFEKQYAKLVFPFYGFAKGITQAVATELMGNPGGKMGKLIRAQRLGSEQREEDLLAGRVLPDHVSRGAFINWGQSEDGTIRALTGLGLMHEQVMNTVGNPAAEMLGLLNPAASFMLEEGTGRSLFFDQPLNQLDPTIGRTLSNISDLFTGERNRYVEPFPNRFIEHMASASPISRAISTVRTATDPRKWEPVDIGGIPIPPVAFNLLTGLKFTDVSPMAQNYAAKSLIEETLQERGGRMAEETYVPQEVQDQNAQTEALVAYQRLIRQLRYQQQRQGQ